jgi:hypothetical protein
MQHVYYLTFMYSSTCFGRPHAHHRELNNCSSSLRFYRWSVVVAVLLVVVGLATLSRYGVTIRGNVTSVYPPLQTRAQLCAERIIKYRVSVHH